MKRIIKNMLKQPYFFFLSMQLRLKVSLARTTKKRIVFILGTPVHPNIGDLAITLAEKEFINNRFNHEVSAIDVCLPLLVRNPHILKQLVNKHDVLAGHGGGNLGDAYPSEEIARRRFVSDFPDNKMIIFPQTIHFSDTAMGKRELDTTSSIYSRHSNLTLIARETISYKIMTDSFHKNEVILTPDIVLSLNFSNGYFGTIERKGALLCLRADKEGTVSNEAKTKITHFLHQNFSSVKVTDTVSTAKLFSLRLKNRVVLAKLKEFAKAEFVLTDRLHGMVFAAITGTPCIAITNFNHKVKGTYNWIEKLPYIEFCDSVDEVEEAFAKLDLGNKSYSYNPQIYDEYWNKIKESIGRVGKMG